VEGILKLLARESEREGEPIGLLPRDQIPTWEFARVYPVGYDQLEMQGNQGGAPQRMDRATELWLGLAQSALATEALPDREVGADAGLVARSIAGHQREAAYDQVIVGYMLQLADELKSAGTGESEKVRHRLSTLVNELGEDTLSRLVEMGGNDAQRRRFVLDANHSLSVEAVVKVVKAAAAAGTQNISSSMSRILSKLAMHADQGGERVRAQADTALRENVDELIANWNLADPNPDQYTAVLDAMARSTPLFQARLQREGEQLSGPYRVIQMALEVDAWGPTVEIAIADLLASGQIVALIQLVDGAPAGGRVADRIRDHLTSPAQLKRILGGEDVDESTLEALTQRMGSGAIDTLLDVLADSDARSVRRKVFDRLVRMGPAVGERAVERLADGRWFVLRNMLALLQRIDQLPPGFDPVKLLDHPDQRVRRESIPLALRRRDGRERVLATALGDSDERMVRMGLLELQKDLPETLVPVLVSRVVRSQRSPEIRAFAARVLGGSRSALAIEVLLGLSTGGKTLFGKVKLADKSPEVLAAVQTLARSWAADPRAQDVLAQAARSKDPELKAAAEAGGRA